MSDKKNDFADDIANFARGLCMGCADIVPGISGGTLALILGHYNRLVTAISHIDSHALRLARQRKFSAAAQHMDLRFLIAIGAGMFAGVLALASLMHYLLEHHLAYVYAVFTGLILASSVIVAKRLKGRQTSLPGFVILGAAAAYWICIQQQVGTELNLLTAFASATVAICAMILPGISGAFILLLLGLYHPVTDLIKDIPKGNISAEGLSIVAIFMFGCLVGLLVFSRVLRWLLDRYHDSTLGFLMGLMLGSLYKIWPFQRATAETAELPFKERLFEHLSPLNSGISLGIVILLIVVAAALTFALEQIGNQFSDESQLSEEK